MSSGQGSNPWAWLGLLKWSLSYADGTSDASPQPMSASDRDFLEKVMKEGIINEGDRMQEILKVVSDTLDHWKSHEWSQTEADATEESLEELRDIVEQIDYARAFASMKGLPFLLGCAQERERIPPSIRMLCLGIIATMAGNNPPIQKELLELGAIRMLSDLYFSEEQEKDSDLNGKMRAGVMQALSSMIRSYDLAEQVFCQTEQAVTLLERSLGVDYDEPVILRQRSLFLLKALVTSDSADRDRIHRFNKSITYVIDHLTEAQWDEHIRELALGLLHGILDQRKSVNLILQRKSNLVPRGVERVAALRGLTGDEEGYASTELELWESILVLLARAEPDRAPDSLPMLPPSNSASMPQ